MGTVGTHAINPSLYSKMPYDHVKDFVPVVLVAGVPNVLVVNPALPANSVPELIAYAKGESGQAQLRIVGKRHLDSSFRRVVQDHGRRRHDARSVQGQLTGAHRPDRRPGADHVRQSAVGAAADQGRQAARDRGDVDHARGGAARCADGRRIRTAGLRGVIVVRHPCARRNAAGDRRQDQCRDREMARHYRSEGKAAASRARTSLAAHPRISPGTFRSRPRNGRRWSRIRAPRSIDHSARCHARHSAVRVDAVCHHRHAAQAIAAHAASSATPPIGVTAPKLRTPVNANA